MGKSECMEFMETVNSAITNTPDPPPSALASMHALNTHLGLLKYASALAYFPASPSSPISCSRNERKPSNLPSPVQRRVLLRGCALDLRLLHPQLNSQGPSLSYTHAYTSPAVCEPATKSSFAICAS